MYDKDPRNEWHPLMRQMPDQLVDLTPHEVQYAKQAAELAMQPRGLGV